MVILLQRLFAAFLYDPAFAQRASAVGLFAVGGLLENGGTFPGTSLVIPHLEHLFVVGPWLKWFGIYLGAGGGLPKLPDHPDAPEGT